MSAKIVTPPFDLAARAGDKTVEQDTFIPLVDMNPLTCAEFLSVRSWKKRAAYLDSLITDSFNRAMKMYEVLELEKQDPTLLPELFAEMRKQITKVLDHLDRLASLPLDEEAFRIFRVCDDPERVAAAVRHWRNDDAERDALRGGSGCMVLRNISIALGGRAVREAHGLPPMDAGKGGAS